MSQTMPSQIIPPDRNKFRVTMKVRGQERSLLSVRATSNGGVIVSFLGREMDRKIDILEEGMQFSSSIDTKKIKEHKYTIHKSSMSPDFTTIHHTIRHDDGNEVSNKHLTKVVKSNTKFSVLCVNKCPNLLSESYATNISDETICLGSFEPSIFSMYYSIIICAVDHKKIDPYPAVANSVYFCINDVIIVILWSFFCIPSIGFVYHHTITVPPEELIDDDHSELNNEILNGFSENEILNFYSMFRDYIKNDSINQMRQSASISSQYISSLSNVTGYFHDGVIGTFEWSQFCEKHPDLLPIFWQSL